ncbi:MAG TPA: ANTAR domain-containing protein [Thiobacillaceae bacterium]|nr:ANTAR domain-containing protein [Thiobacillaceae bacterium]
MTPSERTTPAGTANEPLRVMIVDADIERSRNLRGALTLAGYNVVGELRESIDLPQAVRGLKPHIIIVAADSPDRDTLEHISLTTRDAPRPVVMFTRDGDSQAIRAAVQAGVSAYVVDGLAPDRLRPILEVACARFEAHQELSARLADTERQLSERKNIEKAKGILIKRRGLSEEQAYKELRDLAMRTGKKIGEVAETLIEAAHLL